MFARHGIERLVAREIENRDLQGYIKTHTQPYKELMSYYRCALMEVETKFNVLNEELSMQYDRNPIESIKSRLKSPESIIEKLSRNGYPFSVESIEENLSDIAGIRIVCSYESDIYKLADALLSQDDITLIKMKDYIKNPKESGYRSLHLIVETPIYLHNKKKMMKVEVQLRTISMDWWASLEHKIRYKKGIEDQTEIIRELKDCANLGAELDKRMELLYKASIDKQDN